MRHLFLILLGAFLITLTSVAIAKTTLPLPRFVSLKTDEANVRSGPGLRYPIKWVLMRRHIPLEVIAEFEQWRKVRDIQGDEGWVHRSQLSNKRTATITGATQLLYANPAADSSAVLRAESGVDGEILSCEAHYCQLKIQQHRGWLNRKHLWGTYPGEWIN